MEKENDIVFSDTLIERIIEDPIPMKDILKMEIIQYINRKKGYTYVVDKLSADS